MASSKQKAVERNRVNQANKVAGSIAPKPGDTRTVVRTAAGSGAPEKVKTPVEVTEKTKVRGGPSIRGLITGMIAKGKSTAEITEAVKEQFPTSQAAALPSKHISFYRSRMKKKDPSSVPAKATAAEVPVPVVTAKKGSVKKGTPTTE